MNRWIGLFIPKMYKTNSIENSWKPGINKGYRNLKYN